MSTGGGEGPLDPGISPDADQDSTITAHDNFILNMGPIAAQPVIKRVERSPGDEFVRITSRDGLFSLNVPKVATEPVSFQPTPTQFCGSVIEVFHFKHPDTPLGENNPGITFQPNVQGFFGSSMIQVFSHGDAPSVRQTVDQAEMERTSPSQVILKERPWPGKAPRPRIEFQDPVQSPSFQRKIQGGDGNDIGIHVDTPGMNMQVGLRLANPGMVGGAAAGAVVVEAGEKWVDGRIFSTWWFAQCTPDGQQAHVRVRWGHVAFFGEIVGINPTTKGATGLISPDFLQNPPLGPLNSAANHGSLMLWPERLIRQP